MAAGVGVSKKGEGAWPVCEGGRGQWLGFDEWGVANGGFDEWGVANGGRGQVVGAWPMRGFDDWGVVNGGC